jgi:hypothetical protein
MTAEGDRLKVAARCMACSAVYAAWELYDGSISLIGMEEHCTCGETEFRVME